MTRVDVNLLWLAPGRVGGSEEYLVRQLDAIVAADSDRREFDLTLYTQPAFATAHADLAERVRVVPAPLRRDRRPTRILAEHTWLARRTRGADVVHHGGGTAPGKSPSPTVVTVHDLQYLTYPQYFSRTRLAYLRWAMPQVGRWATVIATPSDFVRSTVIEAFDRAPESVVTVPHPVPTGARPTDDRIDAALARHGVRRPYVIYPAITHPHKAHGVLVDLLRATAAPGHRLHDLHLVLTGGEGAAEPELRAAVAAAGVGDRVVRPGRVPDADRDALLAGAEALVFPTSYEGFGAPLVEAMALDVPIVSSAAAAAVEVAGPAAVVVDAPDGDAWAASVAAAIDRRSELVAAGRERLAAFSPARAAAALSGAYRAAAESRRKAT